MHYASSTVRLNFKKIFPSSGVAAVFIRFHFITSHVVLCYSFSSCHHSSAAAKRLTRLTVFYIYIYLEHDCQLCTIKTASKLNQLMS